ETARCPAPKDLLGILVPYGSYQWYVIYEWKEGVHKDDEKSKGQVKEKEKGKETGKPDADALLKALRAENDADNATRRARGWAERTDLEWEQPPAFDDHGNLIWTTKSNFAGRQVIRSTTRIFGKPGAIDSQLVVARPDELATAANTFTTFLTLVEFTDGPNGGMRREDLASSGGSSGSTSTGATYVPTSTYSASAANTSGGAARSVARSPRTITGFVTG